MNINLPPEQERIVNDGLRSGNSRSAEEVIAKALETLREREHSSIATGGNGCYEAAAREMFDFVAENRTPLHDISIEQLIQEGHRLGWAGVTFFFRRSQRP